MGAAMDSNASTQGLEQLRGVLSPVLCQGLKQLLETAKRAMGSGLKEVVATVAGLPLQMVVAKLQPGGAQGSLQTSLALADFYERKLGDQIAEGVSKFRDGVLGATKARLVQGVLGIATNYALSTMGLESNWQMMRMALQRSPMQLNTDENELQYLLDEIQKLKDKETTELNWQDTAETWVATLQLRSTMRAECCQHV